jgi:hypothetical protein
MRDDSSSQTFDPLRHKSNSKTPKFGEKHFNFNTRSTNQIMADDFLRSSSSSNALNEQVFEEYNSNNNEDHMSTFFVKTERNTNTFSKPGRCEALTPGMMLQITDDEGEKESRANKAGSSEY